MEKTPPDTSNLGALDLRIPRPSSLSPPWRLHSMSSLKIEKRFPPYWYTPPEYNQMLYRNQSVSPEVNNSTDEESGYRHLSKRFVSLGIDSGYGDNSTQTILTNQENGTSYSRRRSISNPKKNTPVPNQLHPEFVSLNQMLYRNQSVSPEVNNSTNEESGYEVDHGENSTQTALTNQKRRTPYSRRRSISNLKKNIPVPNQLHPETVNLNQMLYRNQSVSPEVNTSTGEESRYEVDHGENSTQTALTNQKRRTPYSRRRSISNPRTSNQNRNHTNPNMRRVSSTNINNNADPEYQERRRRNNESAKRSRDARKARKEETFVNLGNAKKSYEKSVAILEKLEQKAFCSGLYELYMSILHSKSSHT